MDYEWIFKRINCYDCFFSKIGLNSIKEYLLDFIKSILQKKKNEDNNFKFR